LLLNNYRNESQLSVVEKRRSMGRLDEVSHQPTDDYLRLVGDIQIELSSGSACMMRPTNDDGVTGKISVLSSRCRIDWFCPSAW
jgi:hypothetical protein